MSTPARLRATLTTLVIGTLQLTACHRDSTSPPVPVTLAAGENAPTGIVGTVVTTSPTFEVRDALGHPLANVPVRVAVTGGGGTLRRAPTRTLAGSPTPVGQWTLGTVAGTNALTITAGSLPPLTLEVTASAGPATRLTVSGGDAQAAPAGARLPNMLAVRVTDQFGNGVPAYRVLFGVTQGGGVVTSAEAISGDDGVATGIGWTLGREGGDQEVAASAELGGVPAFVRFTASIASAFDVTLRFFGSPPPPDVVVSFTRAAGRLHALITSDLADVTFTSFDAARCGGPAEVLNERVDDVVIYATVTTIDGPGRILGSAGPCVIRTTNRLAVVGVMRFDSDDVADLARTERLTPIILHEMLHVVGVGTVWRALDLISGSGTADPRYTGPHGTSRCNASSGQLACGGSVPIENLGAVGTIEAHWREATFDAELMTGYAEKAGVFMPLSSITAGSLEDYGYAVNLLATDPYRVPGAISGRLRRPLPGERGAWEVVEQPLFDVAPTGWVRALRVR